MVAFRGIDTTEAFVKYRESIDHLKNFSSILVEDVEVYGSLSYVVCYIKLLIEIHDSDRFLLFKIHKPKLYQSLCIQPNLKSSEIKYDATRYSSLYGLKGTFL